MSKRRNIILSDSEMELARKIAYEKGLGTNASAGIREALKEYERRKRNESE